MIEIKVTGDNAGEVLNHLAQLTNGLLAGAAQGAIAAANAQPSPAHDPVMPEVAEAQSEADKPKRTRRTREQIAADEAAAKAVMDETEGKDSGTSDPAAAQPETSTTSSDDASALLDFDKDVAPKVLSLVKSRGKPWVVEVLSQFGVERASELPADRWPELLTALEDADAA